MSELDSQYMSRLPTPGSDEGNWGEILNDFLLTTHTADGRIKTDAVSNTQIQDGTVTKAKLGTSEQTSLDKADAALPASIASSTYVKTVNGVGPDGSGNVVVSQADTLYVFVQTGNEVRPAAVHVIWIGGFSRPVNTIDGDVWLSES